MCMRVCLCVCASICSNDFHKLWSSCLCRLIRCDAHFLNARSSSRRGRSELRSASRGKFSGDDPISEHTHNITLNAYKQSLRVPWPGYNTLQYSDHYYNINLSAKEHACMQNIASERESGEGRGREHGKAWEDKLMYLKQAVIKGSSEQVIRKMVILQRINTHTQ